MRRMDTVIHNGTVVTMDSKRRILTPGAVAIRDGLIQAVWTPAPGEPLPETDEVVDAQEGVIMPGLVNTHTHLPMSMFRGLADDLRLDQWLNDHIFPAEAAHLSPQSVATGARLSIAEMLLSGTTACCDGYFLVSDFAPSVISSGIRAVLGQGIVDFPAPGIADPKGNVAHAAAFVENWTARSARLRPSIFCHSPYTCSDATMQHAKSTADRLGVLFQIHVAETAREVQKCRQAHGCTPIEHLQRLGLMDKNTLLVHAVWVNENDIAIIAESGAAIAHCPESNMKLASGIAPVPGFLASGVPCGLGTDGCASNNDLSMFGEMRSAALLHKVQHLDPTLLDANTVLDMATCQGARALGLQDAVGSLETGKQADIVVVGVDGPHMTPMYHPVSHLVYAASGNDVRHVLIDGQWVVRHGTLLTMDLNAILNEARALGREIAESA